MQTERVDFEQNARRVYTAVKRVFYGRTRFSAVECDDEHFTVEGRRGWLISPLSERVKMRVVATGTQSSGYYRELFSFAAQLVQLGCQFS